MLKKSFIILLAMIFTLSLAGSAAANQPEPTYCVLFWMDVNYEFQFILVEGKTTWNETAQVYNASCRYAFDFDSGEWLDVATMCAVFPAYCNPSHTLFTLATWTWESEYGATDDTLYQVGQNGKARYFAQLAPDQCNNMYTAVSYTYLPLEEWAPGTHTYYFIETGPGYVLPYDPIEFTVDESAPLLDSHVRLGVLNLRSAEGFLDLPYLLNPEQETYLQFTWYSDLREDVTWISENITMQVVIDGGDPISLTHGPVVNVCSNYTDGAFEREWGYIR